MKRGFATGMILTSAALLLLIVCISDSRAEQLKVAALYGKVPSELAAIFPGVSGAQAGKQIKIANWKGWKAVYLSFNGKRRLASITFVATTPMSEHEAKRVVQKEFGVPLPTKNEVRAPAVVAYRDMDGLIKTVNLPYVDWKTDKRIGDIGVFFRLGWDE